MWPLAGLLVMAGAAVYGNSLWGAFVYDDRNSILTNSQIRHLRPLWDAMRGPANTPVAGRPVINLSLAVNYALGGLDVRGYHAFNIAVHILCALVLFGIIRQTLLREPLRERFGRSSAGIAAACALVWMVHPLQTEAVDYITQRTESVMGLFYLLTIYTAIRATDSEHRTPWLVASVTACGLGMASKEAIVTAPLMVVLYDWVFRSESFGQVLRRRWNLYAGLAATWVILVALLWPGPRSATVGFSTEVTPLNYAMNQCLMVAHYLRLAVWPRALVFDYGTPQPLAVTTVAPYAALILALLIATIVGLRHWPAVGFLGAWFFLILAPTSSVVPIASEVGAERRMYLPLAGLAALAVIAGYLVLDHVLKRFVAKERVAESSAASGFRRRIPAALVATIVIALGWTSALRNTEYRSSPSIWRTVLERRPHWRAHNNLGIDLTASGRYAEAVVHYKQALPDNPNSLEIHYNLAHALEMLGELDDAIVHYREFLRLKPDDLIVRKLVGVVLAKQGKIDEAIAEYRETLRIKPDFANAHANLGDALLKQQKFDEAANHYRQFLEKQPDNAFVHNNLGLALASLERIDEAIVHYRRAVEIKPDDAGAQFNLGLALSVAGRTDEGEQRFREAIRLKPEMRAAVDDVMRTVLRPAARSSVPKP